MPQKILRRSRNGPRRAAGKVISEQARQAYADLLPVMQEWRAAGLSQQAIADRLNEQGSQGTPYAIIHLYRELGIVSRELELGTGTGADSGIRVGPVKSSPCTDR
jgi:hypothetical protein